MTHEAHHTEETTFFAALGKLIGQYLGGTITARIYARNFMSLRSRFITGAAVDDPTVRDMFTDLEDYVPAYQPTDPAENARDLRGGNAAAFDRRTNSPP